MKYFAHLVLLIIIAALYGCGGSGTADGGSAQPSASGEEFSQLTSDLTRDMAPDVTADEIDALAAGNTEFALNLYHYLSEDETGNLFYSPYSISTALAMTYAGAAGETAAQMADCLRFSLPDAALHGGFNHLAQVLDSRGQGAAGADGGQFRLKTANAVWLQEDFTVLPGYLDILSLNYGAGLNLLDFRNDPEPSRLTINAWVAEQTEDRIEDLLAPGTIHEDTAMVLTNAVYFNAAWRHPFDKESTRDAPFYLSDGSSVSVPMMRPAEIWKYGYMETEDFQAVELLYDGEALSMVILLPRTGRFDAVEAALDHELVAGVFAGLQMETVSISMPRWEHELKLYMKDTLIAMGMRDAFGAGADFSGISGNRDTFIADVIHQAFVKVDEAGTEAAAATAVLEVFINLPTVDKVVDIDRPFIYFIRDIDTRTILFVGRVMDPLPQ